MKAQSDEIRCEGGRVSGWARRRSPWGDWLRGIRGLCAAWGLLQWMAGVFGAAPAGRFDGETQRRWWAFQPLRAVTPPEVNDGGWGRNTIDRFLWKKMDEAGLRPQAMADRRVLFRRLSYDLTGLPPSEERMRRFLSDERPDAYERMVDELLALPEQGERWARRWLDVVRYADYHDGDPKARDLACEPLNAWRYRDWVTRSLNSDLPFGEFVVHQIAGDVLPNPTSSDYYEDGLVATTFLSNGSWDRGDADKEKMVSDMVDDQVDTIGKAFLGLTLGCARCHDHKFDPVTQADYYALAGMFYSTHILKELGAKGGNYTLHRVPLASREFVAKRDQQVKALAEVEAKLKELGKLTNAPATVAAERREWEQRRERLRSELLPEPGYAESAAEGGTVGGLFPGVQDVPIHVRGSYTRLGSTVGRGLPEFFAGARNGRAVEGSGRLDLARWIASGTNAMAARVIVNRVWQGHFGQGLVRTPNNFGLLSEPPLHGELLDWLAEDFLRDGGSLKRLHRKIVTSAAYRLASTATGDVMERDPENRRFSRFMSRRLEAEEIWDSMLAVSGGLDRAMGGAAGLESETRRRALYVQTARWDRGTFAMLFDAANPDASEERRQVSIVAPQALYFLNNGFVKARAEELADWVLREGGGSDAGRYDVLFGRVYGRKATAAEMWALDGLLDANRGEPRRAWAEAAHVLLCSNEFLTVD